VRIRRCCCVRRASDAAPGPCRTGREPQPCLCLFNTRRCALGPNLQACSLRGAARRRAGGCRRRPQLVRQATVAAPHRCLPPACRTRQCEPVYLLCVYIDTHSSCSGCTSSKGCDCLPQDKEGHTSHRASQPSQPLAALASCVWHNIAAASGSACSLQAFFSFA
jgi:hypothetical protein